MSEILFQYQKVEPTTWAYLSSLLIIGLYFKFNRFWSVRNLDLCLVILLAPGLLMVYYGEQLSRQPAVTATATPIPTDDQPSLEPATEAPPFFDPAATSDSSATDESNSAATAAVNSKAPPTVPPQQPNLPHLTSEQARSVMHFGYLWLLSVSLFLLIRLLCDPTMVRRPLLEPNLSNGGLLFIGCALMIFLMSNVLASQVSEKDLSGTAGAAAKEQGHAEPYHIAGPGYYFLNQLPKIPTLPQVGMASNDPRLAYATVARTMSVISHLAVISALVIIGLWHFDNIKLGIGAATMYLLLPYTAQMTGHVNHVLPAALLLWAVVFYRRPAIAGIFIGLSVGAVYYPIFLLPLWISFYWQRGVIRFLSGLIGAVAVLAMSLLLVENGFGTFGENLRLMFGLFIPNMNPKNLVGVWSDYFGWEPIWRLPCIAISICLSALFALWPAQKNLGTLLSCSAAMMIAVQFWHGYGGGTYIAWFMPLMLLTIFRPNLEDRIALTVLGEGWLSKRRSLLAPINRAA
jgi:hypothetical protein